MSLENRNAEIFMLLMGRKEIDLTICCISIY